MLAAEGEHEGKHSPGIAQAPPQAGELPLSPHLGKLIGVEHAGESDSVVQRDLQPPLALLQRRRCRLTSIAAVRPKLLPRLVSNVLGLLLFISAGGQGVRRGQGAGQDVGVGGSCRRQQAAAAQSPSCN